MAFVTKTWKDRLVEYAGRRKIKNVATGEETLVDVSRSEGTVSQAGDAFSAANMNNLEQRIKNEFDTVNSSLNNGNMSFYIGEDGNPYATYKVGADTVTKKLGEPTLIGTFPGSVNSGYNVATFSLASYKNYKNITLANMLIVIQKYGHSSNGASNESFSWTYNQSTGVLSVSHSAMYNITIDVYIK